MRAAWWERVLSREAEEVAEVVLVVLVIVSKGTLEICDKFKSISYEEVFSGYDGDSDWWL